jgi:hypothetical protein
MEESLNKKAILSLGGAVLLPEGFVIPGRVSHSTAGPGAGFGSIAFSFDGYRVKKSISYEDGEFELHEGDGGLYLTHRGEPFIDPIGIEPIVRHCPEQAFFNLDPRCMFRCAYCNSPMLGLDQDKHLSADRIMEMLEESMSDHEVVAVSFTSGVVGSVDETVDRFVEIIGRVRDEYPEIPIGVEPYVSCREHILMLKEAGADEIKINLETPDRGIFARVCPDLDYDSILELLKEAVGIFGKGSVISNIIYGLGETDRCLEDAMVLLCSMGVIPGLRALRVNSMNSERIIAAIGDPEPVTPDRAIRLATIQKATMAKYGLTTRSSHTMCMECGCCDLVPFRDL